MKKVNVDIRVGEPRQEIFIPVYIDEKRMKDIHIVVKDGEYEVVKDNTVNDAKMKLLSYGIIMN